MPNHSPAKSAQKKTPPASRRSRGRAGTIALLGRPNVGKSTFLNAVLGERLAIVSHHPQTTRDRIAGILTQDDVQFVFFDTPGIHNARHRLGERMNDLAKETAAECDVAIFMTEAEAPTPERRKADERILALVPAGTPVILAVNKIDRVQPRERLFPILEELGKLRAFHSIIPISAKGTDASGTKRILAEIATLLPEGEPLYGEDEVSDKPIRFFVAEFVREQILRRTRQEVPHGVAVSVEAFAEGPKVTRITVTVHAAKDSHKGILIGDGGQMLKAVGTAARKRAEQLLGQKIHLDVWVRVTEGWFDDPALLADLGYADEGPKKKKKSKKKMEPKRATTKGTTK